MRKLSEFISESINMIGKSNIVNEKNIGYFIGKPAYKLSDLDEKKIMDALYMASSEDNTHANEITWTRIPTICSNLKPSQKNIVCSKVLAITYDMLENGLPDSLDILVSSDGYIIDGHHRWAAVCLIDPDHKVNVYHLSIDANTMISVLNILTKGLLRKSGNKGSGNIKNLNPANLARIIENAKKGESLKKVDTKLIEKHTINVDNANRICTDIYPGALERIEMPVIDKEDISRILNVLKSGKIDYEKIFK